MTARPSQLERFEQRIAWDLRGHWATRRPVVLILTDRCLVGRIEGRVEYVSVTGAFALVDGWHVPCAEILAVHRPHHTQRAATLNQPSTKSQVEV